MRSFVLVALLATIAAFATAAPAAAGQLDVAVKGPAVVWVTDGSKPAPVNAAEMRQSKKTFVPALLVVTQGSVVKFPNDDDFYHNVFSDGDATTFDLGLYDIGPGKTVAFDKAGVATIRCHVHGSMHATIVVVDGPFAVAERAGRVALRDVRPGRHTLHVWTPDGGERRSSVAAG